MMKRMLEGMMLVTVAACVLIGCGKKENDSSTGTTNDNTVVVNSDAVVAESVEESTEVSAPIVTALEEYDSVISELKPGQWYAFVDICTDYDVLLVADDVFDNGDGNMATIDATIYGFDANGNIIELGTATNGNTAYPLACYDGCLMVANNDCFMMEYVDPSGSMITKKCAEVAYDTDGNATYFVFDLDNEYEGEVEDDSMFSELFEMYDKATVINFFEVQ